MVRHAETLELTDKNAEFIYVELGARWGTWVSRAAMLARTLRPDITFKGKLQEILWSLNSPVSARGGADGEVFGSVGVGREICRVTPSWGTHI